MSIPRGATLVMLIQFLSWSSGCGDGQPDDAAAPGGGTGSTPGALVGSWYAGQGGTSAPYDPNTGSFGRPNGKGLIYIFKSGGRYRKAYQSYASNGGCTNGFTAHEEGTLVAQQSSLLLHPTSGHMVVEDTCAPSLDSDTPLTDLADESFTWTLGPSELDPSQTVLRLRRSDGVEGTFQQL